MANKIITNPEDNRQYFLHYHVFDDKDGYLVQASLFDDQGILISRNKVTISCSNSLNNSRIISKLMKNNILPPDLSAEIVLN